MTDFHKMSRAEFVCWISSIILLVVSFFLPNATFLHRICRAGFVACLFIPMMLKELKAHSADEIGGRSLLMHDVVRLCLFAILLASTLIVAQPFTKIISSIIMALGLLICVADFFLYRKITGHAVWSDAYAFDLIIVFIASLRVA